MSNIAQLKTELAVKAAQEADAETVAALGAEFDRLGGEAAVGCSREQYCQLAKSSDLMDDLGAAELVDRSPESPEVAQLSREFDRAGGEKALGISRDEYVGLHVGKGWADLG